MKKIDFYNFSVFKPYKVNGECYRTLKKAKEAFRKHLAMGHKIGGSIYGYSLKDTSNAITFTPWFCDTKEFGKTLTTLIGRTIDNGAFAI